MVRKWEWHVVFSMKMKGEKEKKKKEQEKRGNIWDVSMIFVYPLNLYTLPKLQVS